VAARSVDAFLARVDPGAPQREVVAMFGRPWNREAFAELTERQREDTRKGLDSLARRFEDHRPEWTSATSADELADALEDLTVVRQVLTQRSVPPGESFAARDRAMADNVLHIEQRYGKGTKAVLWAHNGHVARAWTQSDVMGKYLGQALGDRYVSVGFAFDRGGFQALTIDGDRMIALREHVVGPAKDGDFEATLREGGPELFALSLRTLPRNGEAAAWLRSPLPMRQIGAGFAKDDMSARVIEPVPDRFDVVLFVENTSRARPVHRD
jgi:erythromycin esterase